jgi:nitroreductase
MTRQPLDGGALAQLFSAARSYPHWQPCPIDSALLQRLYELVKWGPTSMNCSPARFVFVVSPEAKARLQPALAAGNVAKVAEAPATVIVAADPHFYEQLPRLFPANPNARDSFAAKPEWAAETAFRNGSLQGAYLVLAARALGLDCGPMSGFDNAKVDAEFFADSGYRSNFLVNIGYGDDRQLYPRGPRLGFDEAARIL